VRIESDPSGSMAVDSRTVTKHCATWWTVLKRNTCNICSRCVQLLNFIVAIMVRLSSQLDYPWYYHHDAI